MTHKSRQAADRRPPSVEEHEPWESRHDSDLRGPVSSNSSDFPDRSSRTNQNTSSPYASGYGRPSGGAYPNYDPGERQGFGDWARHNRGRLRSMWEDGARRFAQYYGRDEPYDREGPHRGRGPKGYSRSDDRIREDVCDLLTDDARIDASDIEVAVVKGEVTLSGHVHSRQDKRRAEDCADDVAGVQHVQNNLRVRTSEV